MSEEEFKNEIAFQEIDVPEQNAITLRAAVRFGFDITVSKNLQNVNAALKEARAVATESILRKVYEDRREEFYKAIEDLHYTAPSELSFHSKIERVLKLAKRQ